MRRIRSAATVLGLALALAACSAAAPEIASPSPSARASPPAEPSTAPSIPALSPAPASSAPSPAGSLDSGAAKEVLDAALATLAEETLRFKADVRSADPDDRLPAVTGTGQVSFGDPSQFASRHRVGPAPCRRPR
jgi:hypothetical protein